MKKLLLAPLLLSLSSCASAGGKTEDLLILDRANSEIENSLYLSAKAWASPNESISEKPIRLRDDASLLAKYRGVIEPRYQQDLQEVYGAELQPAEHAFLLLVDHTSHYAVHVRRVPERASSGRIQSVPGLIYVFERSGLEIVQVMPDSL